MKIIIKGSLQKKKNGIFYDNVQISIVTYPPYLIVTKNFMTNL